MAKAAMEPRGLPPGVYFNPAPEECVNDYLLPWARGERLPELGRFIHEEASIYRHGPDALRRAHPPGTTRAFEPKWYFLSRCKKRGGRAVATGGTWTVEQKQRILDGGGEEDVVLPGATRKSFGFFLGERKTRKKTPWLMEEFTAGGGDGGGEEKDAGEVPVLCRIYVSPRATNDEKRAIFGEAGVAVDADRKKKPERVVIPADQFDALAKLLPKSCRRRLDFVGKGQQAAPPSPPDSLDHHQAFLPPPPTFLAPQLINPTAPPPPPVLLGRQRSQAAPPPPVVPQPNVVPVRRHGHPLPPSPPRPEAHQRSAPSSAESSTRKQEEEAAIRPAKRTRLTPPHAPPPTPLSQDTGTDALQSETLQETPPPPLPQEMLPFEDACEADNEPLFRGSFMDLLAADDGGFDFGKYCEISNQQQMDDGEPLPDIPLDVEFFSTAEFTGFQHPT